MALSDEELDRYARHIVLPQVGGAGQLRLKAARVAIVGAGGIGAGVIPALIGAGVGHLTIIDDDRVELSNLQRQPLYTSDQAGERKADLAARYIGKRNPHVECRTVADRIEADNADVILSDHDLIIDGTDNFATRFAVNRACVARGVPLVSGAALRVEGQIAVFPNLGDSPCYACLYNDEDEWLGDCQGNGVLAPVPGVIGTLMAQEALKLVLGWDSALRNRLLLWDAKRGDWQSVALKRDPECVVCRSVPRPRARVPPSTTARVRPRVRGMQPWGRPHPCSGVVIAWAILFLAGLLEIGWAVGLKYTMGFTRVGPSVATLIAVVASLALLSIAVPALAIGTG
jgi:adenylyltransferase/sulfurtransferase